MIRRGTGRRGGPADRGAAAGLTVTRAREHIALVHTGGALPRRLTDIAEWLGPARADEAVVVVGAPLGTDGVEGLCERLAPVLSEYKDEGVRLLRLVMSAGADEADGRPSTARLVCERWELDVLATAGPAVVVPDGSLFSPDLPDAPGGWWHFSVREVPRPVGSRLPIPDWESALGRLDPGAVPDHVVEPVPAGLVIRPTGTPSAAVHTLPYAVPPDPDRPHLLVDAPSVPAAGLATVIAALPGRVRKDIRLLSLHGHSLVETGQEVADLLGTDVHVANGVPVVVEEGDGEDGTGSTELYLVDGEGTPAWRPFAQTLTCAPATDGRRQGVRVTSWRAPAALLQGTDSGALPFGQTWKVAVTPAGLWAGPRSSEPPLAAATRTAGADSVAIELGAPRRALDDTLWPSLDRLFEELEPEVRERAVVHVHGVLGRNGMENLRRLTVRHDFSLMPQARDETGTGTETGAGAAREAGAARAVPSSGDESFPSLGRTAAPGGSPAHDETEGPSEAERTPEARPAVERTSPERVTASGRDTRTGTPVPAAAPAAGPVPTAASVATAVPVATVIPVATATERAAAGTSVRSPEQGATSAVETSGPTSPLSAFPPPPAPASMPVPGRGPAGASAPSPLGASARTSASGPGSATVAAAETPAVGAGPLPAAASPDTGRPRSAGTTAERDIQGPDHEKLRAYLGPFWKQHRAGVARITERLFAANPPPESDVSIAELAAVHVYMTAVDDAQLRTTYAEGDEQSRTLLRCLRSGMRRLPSYRGATLSTAEELVSRVTPDSVGEEWEATVPVRAVSAGRAYPAPGTDHVLIWSVTGRRTGTRPGGDGQDILFAQECRFRVLGVTRHGAATVGLLQELPQQAHTSSTQLDAALLNRLRAVLDLPAARPEQDAGAPRGRPAPEPSPNPGT
ncbi:hypothetical protein [Streptomyces sp. NPDC001068]|uniref:hypothetical protein n=1 Tax=Streptomyces sp. NPDC001068 TaxID=3364544 RepID=UPI0036932AA0